MMEGSDAPRKQYSVKFKLDAVERSQALGKGGVVAMAKELNIHHGTITNWRLKEHLLRFQVEREEGA